MAEAGGEQEEIEGMPLVGASGRIMNRLWWKANIDRSQLTIANTLSCRPPANVYPTDDAPYCTKEEGQKIVDYCYKHHLKPLLDSRPWERIDAIGAHSLEVLTGKTGIMKWRGSPLPLKGETTERVIGILHPSYLMRDQAMIPTTVSDLEKGVQVPPQHYNLEPTIEELREFDPTTLCFDIETNRFTNQITMVGISNRPYYVTVVPFRGPYIGELKRLFGSAKEVIGQNIIQFDLEHLEDNDVKIAPGTITWDTMLMHHLLHPDEAHDLEFIASRYTQMVAWKHLQSENMAYYNACDVDATIQSFRGLLPVLRQQSLERLYRLVQVPIAKICAMMGRIGVRIDPNRITKAREECERELHILEESLPPELRPFEKSIRVRRAAPQGTVGKSGKPIKFIHVPGTERVTPWDSPKQVETYLYKTLALPVQRHPKTKRITTDKQAIDRLHKLCINSKDAAVFAAAKSVDAIRKVRSMGELIGTFLQEGNENKQVAVGRIHSNFLVHGTSTGRLASSGPNLQNIPPKAKYIYVPSHTDWCFVEADISSLENRLAAWYAGDSDRLARMSDPNFNEHRRLASELYHLPESEIDKKSWQYDRAKHTNHGCDAGMGVRKMAIQYGFTEKESREAITKWRELNAVSYAWQERIGNKAGHDGVLTTAFDRKRWFWTQSSYTDGIRFMTQSSGADVCFRAMIGLCYERIGWPEELAMQVTPLLAPLPLPARLIIQVHDSLLVEGPYSLVPEIYSCMTKVMTQPWPELAGYAFPIDIKVGEPGASWAELKAWRPECK